MKSSRAVIMLGLSLLAGIVAVVLAARWLTQQSAPAPSKQVVVAAADVGIGQVLGEKSLAVVQWTSPIIPKGAFTDPKQLDGRVLITDVQRGEPILEAKLAAVGTKGGLSAVIPEGKRAITVRVNEVVGVAGFTLPGNYVDVMVNTEDEAKKQVSKIVLEKILVLAVAQQANRDETAPKVVNAVTLEVTPEQAEKLDLARSVGNLSLVLRNQVDTNPTLTSGARKTDLLGGAPVSAASVTRPSVVAPVSPAPAPRPRVAKKTEPEGTKVEIIRGVQRSSAQL